ncbi:MAG: VOC family protein [Phycisphaerae bacterium]|nr:VOC family protein [Phycisphaerae bacterium]
MTAEVQPVPEGFHTVTPSLNLKDSLAAIEFYKKAFGAQELGVLPSPDGKGTMHAAIQIGDSILMMGDERPDMCDSRSAESLGASPIGLYIYMPNVDAAFKQAIDAGGAEIMPVADMFWGDRCGTLKDPFGYTWTIATHTRDLSPEEMHQEAQSFFAAAAKG